MTTPGAPAGPAVSVTTLALLLGGLFGLGGLGSTAMAVVLPQAADALDISLADSSWLISLYALTMAIGTPIYGRLVDMYGVRAPLLSGVVLMSTGALLAAFSHSFAVMVIARLLQGLGTGVGFTLSVAVISTRFVGADRIRGLAVAAGTAAAIGATGPLIGGITEALFTWRGTTALPALGLVLLTLLWRRVAGPGGGSGFDILGALLVSVAAGGVIMLLQSASSGATIAVIGAAAAALAGPLVVRRSHRASDVFLPASVLLNRRLLRVCLVAGVIPAAWFALLVAVPTELGGHGMAPVEVGVVLLPSTIVALAVPRMAPYLTARWGQSRSLSGAAVIATVALLIGAVGVRAEWVALMVVAVAMVSGAFSAGQPTMFAMVADAADPQTRGAAAGFAALVFLTCGSAGSAIVGGMVDVGGIAGGLAVLAVVTSAGVVLSVIEVRARESR